MRGRDWLLVLSLALAACAGGGASPTVATPDANPTDASQPTITLGPATIGPTGTPAASGVAISVPGTHVTMTPPEGFFASSSFVGFEHECGASILVAEVPAGYAGLVEGMTDARFAEQGITEITRSDETVDGRSAVFLTGRQEAAGLSFMKLLVITGTDTLSAFITGNLPIATCEPAIGTRMRDAELGIQFDPDRPIDPMAALRFTLTPAAPLKFAGALNNGALYNISGKVPSPDPGEPSLIVAPSLGGGAGDDVVAFAIMQLDSMTSIRDVAVESSATTTIAGRPAAIVIATATSSTRDVDVAVYNVLLGGDGDYVAFLGICDPGDRAQFFDVFDASIRTYEPK